MMSDQRKYGEGYVASRDWVERDIPRDLPDAERERLKSNACRFGGRIARLRGNVV